MLGLKLPTDPRWVDLAKKNLEEILTDHAYCEMKAATQCISLIQMYPDQTFLVDSLAPIVSEEWGHFRMVLNQLKQKNLPLGNPRKDIYVVRLREFILKGGTREDRMMDHLLVGALIEARSCERFRILSEHLEEEEMRNFYHTFMVSEASHYRLFKDIALHYHTKEKVEKRWQEFLDYEKQIMEFLALRGDRVH